jgi:hypothetical protein
LGLLSRNNQSFGCCSSFAFTNQDVFEYLAFERILDKITARFGKWRIGMPLIGMGLAGGNPERILPLIERFSSRMEALGGSATLVEWERK